VLLTLGRPQKFYFCSKFDLDVVASSKKVMEENFWFDKTYFIPLKLQ